MLNEAGILGFMFICVFSEILTLMGIVAKYCKYPKAATLLNISPVRETCWWCQCMRPAPVLYAGIFLAGAVIIFISMGVSIRIYRKKDLA